MSSLFSIFQLIFGCPTVTRVVCLRLKSVHTESALIVDGNSSCRNLNLVCELSCSDAQVRGCHYLFS